MSQSFFQRFEDRQSVDQESSSSPSKGTSSSDSCLESPFLTLGSVNICVSDLIIFTLCIVIMIGCGALFVISPTQISSNTKTPYVYLEVGGSTDHPCDKSDFYNHRPFKFRVDPDTEYLYCPWPTSNTGSRMTLAFVAFFMPLFYIIGKIKNRRWPLWIFCGICLAGSVGFFLIMCVDSNDVRISHSWCEDGLPGLEKTFDADQVVCNYQDYIVVCLIDAALFILWGICFGFITKYMVETRK